MLKAAQNSAESERGLENEARHPSMVGRPIYEAEIGLALMLAGSIKMTDSFLEALAADFAWGIHAADAKRPIAVSQRAGGASYQPGLGPHTEATTVELVLTELRQWKPTVYGSAKTNIPYPNATRQRCDIAFDGAGGTWYVEAKMMRLMGDNGKPNDNILTHILSPYPQHRSALTDCEKLSKSGFGGRYAIAITESPG